MSENFSIQGYECTTKSVFQTLSDKKVNLSDLKKIDKNSDNKISEDELVEFQEMDDNTAISEYKDEDIDEHRIKQYHEQIEKEEADIKRNSEKIRAYEKYATSIKTSGGELSDSDKKRIQEYEDKVANLNSKIDSSYSKIRELNNSISNILNSNKYADNNGATSATSSIGAMGGTAANTGITDPSQVSSAASKGAANLKGELSSCLDNIAKSLNCSRDAAYNYIEQLCKNEGCGYFTPELIISQVYSESSGNQSSVSSAGAYGLGQLKSVAVQEVNNKFGTSFKFSDVKNNGYTNLKAMIYYMRYQYNRYGNDVAKALTAYNRGNCNNGVINSYAKKIMSRVA